MEMIFFYCLIFRIRIGIDNKHDFYQKDANNFVTCFELLRMLEDQSDLDLLIYTS